jgi:hypothetical protein
MISDFRWLFSKRALAHAAMLEHMAKMSRDPDRAFLLREVAGLQRRVTGLQRALLITSIGLAFLGLGELMRGVVFLLSLA